MARSGLFIPCEGPNVARSAAKELRHSFEEVRIIRLSDRTEPTLTKRVEILEEQAKRRSADVAVMFHDVSKAAFERLTEAEQRIDALETAPQSIRPKPGRQGGEATFDPIARRTAVDTLCRGLAALDAGEPDPDRLAKVAFLAAARRLHARGEVTWEKASESVRDHYRAIASAVAEAYHEDRAALPVKVAPEPTDRDLADRFNEACAIGANGLRAIYDIGLEHGGQDHDASEDARELAARSAEVTYLHQDTRRLRERAEKAEAEAKSRDAELDAAEKLLPAEFRCEPALLGVDGIPRLVADWKKRGERLTAMKGRRADDMRRGFEIGKANDDDWSRARQALDLAIATTEPIAHVPDGEPRDPVKNPQGGEWFLDEDDGTVRGVLWGDRLDGEVAYLFEGQQLPRSLDLWRRDRAAGRARLMTTDEVDAFKSHGTRPSKAP